jgi:hypothetical protein
MVLQEDSAQQGGGLCPLMTDPGSQTKTGAGLQATSGLQLVYSLG